MRKFKKISPHLIVILLFVGISFTYFSPVLQGKLLNMADITHHKGMSKEVTDFREATGEERFGLIQCFQECQLIKYLQGLMEI